MIVYPYAFKVYWCLMNNYKIWVNIEIVECEEPVFETPTRQDDGSFELNMSSSAAESIDDCEQFLLSTNYPALRAARAWAFRSGVKKKLLDQAPGQALVEKPTPYRVDGEVGRFSFPIYALAEPEDSAASFPPNQLFPPQVGKTWYRTRGFKELTYVHGTPERSSTQNEFLAQSSSTSARGYLGTDATAQQRSRSSLNPQASPEQEPRDSPRVPVSVRRASRSRLAVKTENLKGVS